MSLTSKLIALGGAALTGAMLLSGCASSPELRAEAAPRSTQQFPTPVAVKPQQLLLTPHAEGLSAAQRAAVYTGVQDWRSASAGPVVVETPTGGGEVAVQAAARVDEFLEAYGLTGPDVEFRRYEAADAKAPIRVTFPVYAVEIPDCGQVWTDLARSNNSATPNFGCANAANIAAMVANPADLAFAKEMTPADASRRQVVLEKYRQGQVTSSARDVQANGTISKAID